jgi:RNA polymerase sigma factor (TIGR02999 family)
MEFGTGQDFWENLEGTMSDGDAGAVTRVLRAAARGEPGAAADLLPLVYDELRRLARARLAKLPPGQTLQATALVHEAYLRVVRNADPGWDGRAHFFGAAAQAIHDILIDQARRKATQKHGGGRRRVDVDDLAIAAAAPGEDLLALDEALARLERLAPRQHRVVMLCYFAGLEHEEVAEVLGITARSVRRDWRYAKAWLLSELSGGTAQEPRP